MFDKEFYPTPEKVLDSMDLDCYGKVIYEPHGGKGDIIKYCLKLGANRVLASEKNDDLRKVCSEYAHIIGSDFFDVKSSDISHIDMIVMNPPFSNAADHILHAWQIAPEGCEIISLCNWETINNTRYSSRKELVMLINNYGNKENLGNCFSDSERETDVNVGLVRLFKPILSEDFNYDGFFYGDEFENINEGVIRYDEIRAIVNGYVGSVKKFDEFQRVANDFNSTLEMIGLSNVGNATFEIGRDNTTLDKYQFIRELQFKCWAKIFDKLKLNKYVTKGVMDDINKFINSRKAYPFTMRNVYKMLEIIVGTSEQTMNRAICEAIDNFTKHTKENVYGVEGWVTNKGHFLNTKFIINRITEISIISEKCRIDRYGSQYDRLNDLVKALCYVTGTNYDTIPDLCDHVGNELITNKWYAWGFFDIKFFNKGTAHVKFKSIDDWAMLNQAYGKIKGMVLPNKK